MGNSSQPQKNPIQVAAIDHVVIRIVDLELMLDFYCGVLGCVVERRQDEIGLIQLRAGNALIDLVPVTGKLGGLGGSAPGSEGRNMDHLCLRLEQFDVGEISGFLEAKGINAGDVGSRYGAEGFGPSIYINDPEGNVIELKGSAG